MVNIAKNVLVQALNLSPIGTVIIDARSVRQPIAYLNPAFESLTGYATGDLLGLPWTALLDAGQPDCQLPAKGSSHIDFRPRTMRLRCHERLGTDETFEVQFAPLYDGPGVPAFWVGSEQPAESSAGDSDHDELLSVLREARRQLQRMDGRDAATGLLERRAFEELLQRDWLIARRSQRPVGVLILRVDALDEYRELFGRHAADACLRKVAHAVAGSLHRGGDLAGRYSEDSFVVLASDVDAVQAASLAANIAAKVRDLAIHHPRCATGRFITLSTGCAVEIPGWTDSCQSLLERASKSLRPVAATGEVSGLYQVVMEPGL